MSPKLQNSYEKKSPPSLDIAAFINDTQEALLLGLDKPQANEKSLSDFENYRITKEKYIPDLPAVITFGNSKIAAPCNITPITAEAKAGKTAAVSVFIAGAISKDGIIDGFTDVDVLSNPEGKAVIHFDTEQSEADQQYNVRTALKRAYLDTTPDYYHSYNIRTLGIKEYQDFTDQVCRLCNEKYNGIHLIVIDGGADYITSVNDETEANAIITYFTRLAVAYTCPLILVVHLNENAGKNNDTMPRGHVGRQAVRKGYCQLNITKSGDIAKMQALRARKASSLDTPMICYQYDIVKGYHVSVDAETANDKISKSSVVRIGLEKTCKKVLPFGTSLSYTDLVSKLMQATDKATPTAKRYVNDLTGWGLIVKGEDGNYRVKTD